MIETRLAYTRLIFCALTLFAALTACSKPGGQSATEQYLSDTRITTAVKAGLMRDATIKATDVDVKTVNGQVHLSGFVGSEAAKRRAEEVAKSVSDVRAVDNKLAVQAVRESAGDYLDDATITAKVKATLLADSRVKGLVIDVETLKGTVQLNGTAKSDAERRRAEELAKSVDGVTTVKNNIAVN
jgi:hyperosmotically inducible periplasmic protein